MEVHQPHDDLGLLGAAFGDQPAGRLGQHLPGEEEEGERGHGDDLHDLPGGHQPANQREEDLAQGPGDADDADDEAPLADVGDLADDVHRGLKQGQHPEGRGNLDRNIIFSWDQASVLHSHWSRSNGAGLSFVESFSVLLRQQSYAIKNQRGASKKTQRFFIA